MRVLRPFIWAVAMAAGFVYLTSVAHWDPGKLLRPIGGRLWSEPANAATGYSADEQNNIEIYRAAKDATVSITSVVVREDWFFGSVQGKGSGSGFLINPEGEILTNNHVVGGTAQLTVQLADKKSYRARVLFKDPRNDMALIKIDAGKKLPALKLGDSDSLVVGQKVLAIGNPFGQFSGTLTTGVVSSLDRSIQTEDQPLEGMIQTDAAINPGNSGGPLLDSHGNVIGMNTAIYGQQGNIGLGFAMPINRAKMMLDQSAKNGHISRPTLGITTVYVAGDLAEALRLPGEGGLLIQQIEEGSAAQEAGLRGPDRRVVVGNYPLGIGGDLIVAVEGQPVEGKESLSRALSRKKGGDPLEVTVYRGGRRQQVRVKLGEAPQVL
jgi:S1-C subfamily serine protease